MQNTGHRVAIFICWISLLPLLCFTGCYPGESEETSDLEVVATEYDVNFHFSSIRTFIMPDTVMHITDPNHPEHDQQISAEANKLLLKGIPDHLRSLGYKRMLNTQYGLPDVYVTISVVATTYILNEAIDWWHYWAYYPWWPGWKEGVYPWCPWGSEIYKGYTQGTVVVQMQNSKVWEETKIPVVWQATFNGLLKGTEQPVNQRIKRDLDLAFEQSPYLKIDE